MREKERIDRIMALLYRIWRKQPDLRFLQLISTIQWKYSVDNGQCITTWSYSKHESEHGTHFTKDISNTDGFNVEDDKLEEFLMEYIKKI